MITMNPQLELLLTRRTIRSYKSDMVPDELLNRVLNAAKYAPTAMGLQNRHFTVVKNQELMRKITAAAQANGGSYSPGHTPFYNAPIVIVVSAPKDFKYNREDSACAIMNILLAAHACGLAACYICSVLPGLNDKKILEKLNLPQNYVPYGSVCLGYPAVKAPEPKARRTDDINYID